MKLSGLLLIMSLLNSCAAAHSTPPKPWRLEIATSGGITGRGNGTYSIHSDGAVSATFINGRSCTFQASAADLKKIEALLADAKPSQWKAAYIPENPCCDRIEYALTLDEAGTVTKTRWIDDPPPMPKDLTAIGEAIISGADSLRAHAAEQCR